MKRLSYSWWTLGLLLLLLVIFPSMWFLLDKSNLLSTWGIIGYNNPPSGWSGIFIGYFGSAFAAVAGYIAVILSLKKQEDARKEDNAKEVLPLLSAEPYYGGVSEPIVVTNDDYESASLNTATGGILKLQNVGMREMYDLRVISMESDRLESAVTNVEITPILYKDSSAYVCIYPVMKGTLEGKSLRIREKTFSTYGRLGLSINIAFGYQDCYGNKYIQNFKLICVSQINTSECYGNTVVYTGTAIERCDIVSAPKPQG